MKVVGKRPGGRPTLRGEDYGGSVRRDLEHQGGIGPLTVTEKDGKVDARPPAPPPRTHPAQGDGGEM